MIGTAVEKYGKINILYNNAGIAQKPKPVESISEEEWEQILAVNLKSIFLGTKYVVPEMKKIGGGVIINTASISGVRVRSGTPCYTTSKGAAITLTKALALELAPFNIRVNCINLVAADTPMLPEFLPQDTEEVHNLFLSTIPLGRFATPEDIAYVALYLASDEASLVTGVALGVDGGRGI